MILVVENSDERTEKQMIKKRFLVGIHVDSLRPGKPAEILGFKVATPEGCEPCKCWHIRFANGTEYFVPISDADKYKTISEEDIRLGKIPPVVH